MGLRDMIKKIFNKEEVKVEEVGDNTIGGNISNTTELLADLKNRNNGKSSIIYSVFDKGIDTDPDHYKYPNDAIMHLLMNLGCSTKISENKGAQKLVSHYLKYKGIHYRRLKTPKAIQKMTEKVSELIEVKPEVIRISEIIDFEDDPLEIYKEINDKGELSIKYRQNDYESITIYKFKDEKLIQKECRTKEKNGEEKYKLLQYNRHGLLIRRVQEDSSKRIETVRDEENPFIIHRNIQEDGTKTEEIYAVYKIEPKEIYAVYNKNVRTLKIDRLEKVDGSIEEIRKEQADNARYMMVQIWYKALMEESEYIKNKYRKILATWKDVQKNQNINLDEQGVQL